MLLSVIMPVYNEAATIDEIIKRLDEIDIDKEIIIVDDGSTDGTRQRLENYRDRKGIKIVFHPYNQGKGAAV